jgi:octaprenyl-diphosphate synthase
MDRLPLIKAPITTELEDFKRLFDSSLSSSNLLLNNVIAHIRQRNGKMMRPILVLLVARLYGGTIRPATLHAAVSLELLHTASLVHDDVVDESTERRGQLSVNAIYNNKVAVLAGDFLLATSLVHAGKTMSHEILEVISCLGQDLAEGELLQLSNVSNPQFSEEIYFDVIRKKTAALFAACTKSAALSVHTDDEKVEMARLFGEYIGICFQIKDDIFDYFENKALGKPTGNDMLEGKLTLPAIYALNSTSDSWAQEVAARIKGGTATSGEIARLIEFSKENGGIEYAVEQMGLYKEKALDLLHAMPGSDVCEALEAYLDYVVYREK